MTTKLLCFFLLSGLLSLSAFAQDGAKTHLHDSLFHRQWDLSLLEARSHPKTERCDSAFHYYWQKYFYYDSDSLFHLIATRKMEDIAEDVYYYYDLMDACHEKLPSEREKLLAAVKRYHSKALERELDIFDTHYRWNISEGITQETWDFMWRLAEKYEQQGDLHTKLRILYRLLWGCSGFPTYLAGKNMKERVPLIQLINETLSTLDRLDRPYIMNGGVIYQHIACIYFDFEFYDKAIPLFWKSLSQPTGYYFDRTQMKARDYLGAYYNSIGDYERSDSLYFSILNSPDTVMLRPIDDVIALGALGRNELGRENPEKAFLYYSQALPLALQVKDSTLAGSFALRLARIYLDKNEKEQAFAMLQAAKTYTIAGNQLYRNWENYYTLSRDYYLKTNQAEKASTYIDSIASFQKSLRNDYDTRILAFAEQELYEKEAAVKKEQLQMHINRLKWLAIILFLTVAALGILIYSNRLKQEKNKRLVRQILEQDRILAEKEQQAEELRQYRSLLKQQNATNEADTGDDLWERFKRLMQDSRIFTNPDLNRKMLTDKLNTNEVYLRETVTKHYGHSIGDYVNELRLNYARELLAQQSEKYTVEAIALDSGFGSRRSFQRLFNKQYGLSPDEYRKLLAGK